MTGPNPKLYRELSEPFESSGVAEKAIEGFSDAVEEARKKFKIREVYCIAQFPYITSDGEEVTGGYSIAFGDAMHHEQMLASALGQVQVQRQEMIAKLVSQALKKGRSGG